MFVVAGTTVAATQPRVERNVIYGMYSGLALLLDVHYPEKPNGYGLVFISGSGWTSRSRMVPGRSRRNKSGPGVRRCSMPGTPSLPSITARHLGFTTRRQSMTCSEPFALFVTMHSNTASIRERLAVLGDHQAVIL